MASASGLLISPSVVEMRNVISGEPRSVSITVKNNDKRTKTLRLRPPKQPKHFLIKNWTASQSLAPGLETTFEVVFSGEGMESAKESILDRIIIQCEHGELEVPLKAFLPLPDVSISGSLNFGFLPLESKSTRRFQLVNKGAAPAQFKIDFDRSTGIIIEPSQGEIPAAVGSKHGVLEVVASITLDTPGSASGDLSVQVQGTEEARRITYNATGVKHSFELMESVGGLITEVDFGISYFGERAVRTFEVFNNGPAEGRYAITFGAPSEIKKRIEELEGVADGGDTEDPYGGYLLTAKQKVRSRETKDNPFSLDPLTGTLEPFKKATIRVSYAPEDLARSKGFSSNPKDPEADSRDYRFMALIELVGSSQRIKLPIHGKAMHGGLRLSPPVLDFSDVKTNEYADQLILAINTNPLLQVIFQADKKTPYFTLEPSSGTILGGQDQQLLVRYHPKSMGKHSGTISVRVFSENGKMVQDLALKVSGTSLRMGEKQPLIGGTDKLPLDFKKPAKLVDGENMLAARLETMKLSSKRGLPLWERPGIPEAIAGITPENALKYTLTREQMIATIKHREQAYQSTLGSKREAKKNLHLTRRIEEGDINLGMNTKSGLNFEPKIPKVNDPMWIKETEDGLPQQPRSIMERDIESIPLHKDRPESEVERIQCSRELSKAELSTLIVGPKVVDFGTVSVGSSSKQHLIVTNPLETPIHVVLGTLNPAELRKSTHVSQVIPPLSKARFPLIFNASDVRSISNERVDYCINSSHVLSFGITANVVNVNLDLSSDDLHFDFSPDAWTNHVDKVLFMSNNNKFPVEYQIASNASTFTVTPMVGTVKPNSSGEVTVRWSPVLDGSAAGSSQQGQLLLTLAGNDFPRRIHLHGQLPEGGLKLKDKAIAAGKVPCGIPQTLRIQLKNGGTRVSAFRVAPHPFLMVTPLKDKVAPGDSIDLEVTFNCLEPGALSTTLEVEIQGGKPLKLPITAEGVIPRVEVLEDEYNFGQVFLGNNSKLPLTLANPTLVPATATIDLRRNPELQLLISKDAWSTKEYEQCPLQCIGPSGESIGGGSGKNSISGSRRGSRRNSSTSGRGGCLGGSAGSDGIMYHIHVNPNAELKLQLVYRPSALKLDAIELCVQTNSNGVAAGALDPVLKAVVGEGTRPRLVISKTQVDFESKIVIRSNSTKPPYTMDVYLSNPGDETVPPVKVSFGKMGGPAGIFTITPSTLTVDPGEMIFFTVNFFPRDAKTYEATLPMYLDGDTSAPYMTFELVGAGQFPSLTFNLRECALPPVPLNTPAQGTLYIVNNGYDNCELRHRLPPDEGHAPIRLEFPEGNLIGLAKQELPVIVHFISPRPLSFTANIDFMDEEGKRYSIPITATADNCLLTHHEFMVANGQVLNLQYDVDSPVVLLEREGVVYEMPEPSSAIGPFLPPLDAPSRTLSEAVIGHTPATLPSPSLSGLDGVKKYLEAITGRQLDNLLSLLVSSRGKLALELIEVLSGKQVPPPRGASIKTPSNKKEAAEQLLATFDSLLVFLKAHGAFLNAVKPEMLLDAEDLNRVLNARETSASSSSEVDAIEAWADVEAQFENISKQAWTSVLLQSWKVFVLGRAVSPGAKALRSVPGSEKVLNLLPTSDAAIQGSNLYSNPELSLLAWMSAFFCKEFGLLGRRVVNFDADLNDGLVLFSLLVGHWPSLATKRQGFKAKPPINDHDRETNNETVIRIMSDLGLPYVLTLEDLMNPDPRNMTILILYLFQTLPQLMPKASLPFECKLGETAAKDLELSNPSKRPLYYTVKLEGHKDFSAAASLVRIDPRGTAKLGLKCTPSTTVPTETKLVLMSKKEGGGGGGANAAIMVFKLESAVNSRAALKRVRSEGPVYEMQMFEILVTNPFPTDGDFIVTLFHEPAEPLPPKESEEDQTGKKKGEASSARGGKGGKQASAPPPEETNKPQIFPNAFGVDRLRFRMKQGGQEKIKGFFLPFTLGTHYCTLVFKEKELGQFAYELVGEATLPAPSLETRGMIPLEGPYVHPLFIPWINPPLEAAKKLFIEKHPLAKDKQQVAFLKSDALRLAEISYQVSQTNSLMTTPTTLTLYASGGQEMGGTVSQGGLRGLGGTTMKSRPANADSTEVTSARGPSGKMEEAPAPRNCLRLGLKPIGSGVYPTRLLLTSSVDVRVVDLEVTAQNMTQKFSLEFSCAARQLITQEVPLINTSPGQSMSVSASLEGKGFSISGSKEVTVPAGGTGGIILQFKPTQPGDHKGQLVLTVTSTGERNIYTLAGRAAEPLAEGHILLETQARKPGSRQVNVPNVTGSPVEYEVLCDLQEGIVAGPATLKSAPGQSVSYRITAAPQRAGVFIGSLSFKAPDGQVVWYVLEVRASEPEPLGSIQISAAVHSAVGIKVPIANPLSSPVSLNVEYSDPDAIFGPTIFHLPSASTSSSSSPSLFEFYYSPLRPCKGLPGSVKFSNNDTGDFWYQLVLDATPAPIEALPSMSSELGGLSPGVQKLTFDNPLSRAHTFSALSSQPKVFKITPGSFTLDPYGSIDLSIEYFASRLPSEPPEQVSIQVDGGDEAGAWEYQVAGKSLSPSTPHEPLVNLVAGLGGSGRGHLVWRNPFPTEINVAVSLSPSSSPDILLGLEESQTLPPFSTLKIPLTFRPSSIRPSLADLVISCSEPGPVSWTLPIRGLPEAATPSSPSAALSQAPTSSNRTFSFKCKCLSSLNEVMEVVLKGLISVGPDDVFTHVLNVPPEHKAHLIDQGALKISPLGGARGKLTRPDQPLAFSVRFAPIKPLDAVLVELVVSKASGGKWRFELELEASEGAVDAVVTLEAGVHQTVHVPVFIQREEKGKEGEEGMSFRATFSPETPLSFTATPLLGTLPVVSASSSAPARASKQGLFVGPPLKAIDNAAVRDMGVPALWLSYTSIEIMGKTIKGRLTIITTNSTSGEDNAYLVDLRGKMPTYVPPNPSSLTTSIDNRLRPEVESKLKAAKDPSRAKGIVATNAKTLGRK